MNRKLVTTIVAMFSGVITGMLLAILLFLPFVTGDPVVEYLADGGSFWFVLVYFMIVGVIVGSVTGSVVHSIVAKKEG